MHVCTRMCECAWALCENPRWKFDVGTCHEKVPSAWEGACLIACLERLHGQPLFWKLCKEIWSAA